MPPFPPYLTSSVAASHIPTLVFPATSHFVPVSVTTLTEKLVHLPARPHSEMQNTYVDTHYDVLWHKRHERKSRGRAKQRAPHGREHVGACGLEHSEHTVCCAQGEKG
jgi:hypothetical protein